MRNTSTQVLVVSGMALTALSGLVTSHDGPPTPPPGPATSSAAVYDPQQFPAISGELERLTLTARGDVDGFIFKDGTEVKTPPALSTQITLAMKPGDRVTVHGLKAAALPLVRAMLVTDEVSKRTVTDLGVAGNPPPPPTPPRGDALPPANASAETSGRVRMALHGSQGEVNGVLLEGGTILRFPPDSGIQLTSLLQPRQSVVAQGPTIANAAGTVVDVQQLGASRDRLVAVGPGRRPPPSPGSMRSTSDAS